MHEIKLSISDEAMAALNLSPDEVAGEVNMAAAVKLYEMGRLSSGAAALLAGVPRALFLSKLGDYGVVTFRLSEDDCGRIWPVPEIISDTSPLPYLFQTRLFDLLRVLYAQITIPQAVVDEIAAGRALGILLPDLTSYQWIHVRRVSDPARLPVAPDLGLGEREVLALAVETADSLALLDDALARRQARLLNVTFTGTLGVLLKAKQEGHLPAVAPVLDEMKSLAFRLDAATRAAVLNLARE